MNGEGLLRMGTQYLSCKTHAQLSKAANRIECEIGFACSRRSDSGARAKNKANERAGKNEGRLGKTTRERL